MSKVIIGRIEEISTLEECYHSNKANFVAVYGRRRVGKTYLIKSLFEKRMFFTFTGTANSTFKMQITNLNVEAKNQLNIDY